MPHLPRRALVTGSTFVVVSLLHLGAHLTGHEALAERSQWLLMPLLALTLVLATRPESPAVRRPRLVKLLLVALVASWLGDTAPDLVPDGASFLTMVGFFLVAQVVLVAAFWPGRGRSILALGSGDGAPRRRLLVVPYAAALVALVVACAPGAGPLLVPVMAYGVALVSMAVLATGINRLTWLGGAVFLVSDALIALDAFASGYDLPRHGFWVMLTYIAAQALLVAGVHRQVRGTARQGTAAGQPATPETSASTASVS